MSLRVMNRVWERSQSKGSALLVLLSIADQARDNGIAWPGYHHIAHKCRLSRRQVIRIIADLEKLGELQIVRSNAGNRYWITVWGPEGIDVEQCAYCGLIEDARLELRLHKHHPDKENEPDLTLLACPDCHEELHGKLIARSGSDKLTLQQTPKFRVVDVTSGAVEVTSVEPVVPFPVPEVTPVSPESLVKQEIQIKEEDDSSVSYDQTPWVMALADVRNAHYRKNKANWETSPWVQTWVVAGSDGHMVIGCTTEDDAAWLIDRGSAVARHALTGVLGRQVDVEFLGPAALQEVMSDAA